MALTDAEKLELAQLEQEMTAPQGGGLTPEEAQELKALEAELQPQAPSNNTNYKNVESGQYSPGESALQGFGSSATLGYLPKMQAAVMAGLDPELNYEQAKQITQKRDQALLSQNPVSYGAGTLGGAIATPIPGLGAVKGASLGAKVGKAALQGAAIGGASDTGLDMGTQDDLRERLKRASVGGALGGGLQGAGSGLQGLASKLKEYGTFKLLGARGKDAEKLLERNKAGLQKADQFLDQEGIVGPLTTNASLAKSAEKLANESGQKIGKVYDRVAKEAEDLLTNTPVAATEEGAARLNKAMSTRLDPNQMADDFMMKATEEFQGVANGNQILSSLQSQVENLRKVKAEKGIQGIVDFRKSLDDALAKSYQKPFADVSEKQDAMMALRRYIKDQTNEHISALDDLVGSNSAKELAKLNNQFSNASTIKRLTSKSEIAQMRNNLFGLPEMIAGTGAAGYEMSKGDPSTALAKGVGAAAGLKLARSYGPAMSRSLGKAIQKAPQMPVSAVVTPWTTLSKKEQK